MTAAARAERRSVDAFLGGSVTLVQPRGGHRAGLDAALLQALVPASADGLAVDLGSGVGTIAFCIAARAPALSVAGVERDAGLVECGTEALAHPANASFAARVRLVAAAIAGADDLPRRLGVADGAARWVLMNPPFDAEARGTPSPDLRRRAAHRAPAGLLAEWVAAAAALLERGGTLCLIERAEALPAVLAALGPRFGDIGVLPVHASAEAHASRVLVTARLGRRTPLRIAPGLVLHERDDGGGNRWTARAERILRGAAELVV